MVLPLNEIYSDRDRIFFVAGSGEKSQADKIFFFLFFFSSTKLSTRLLNFIPTNYVRDTRTGSFVYDIQGGFIFVATFVDQKSIDSLIIINFPTFPETKTINAHDINDYLDKALSLLRIIVPRNECIRQPIITNYHSSFRLFGKRSFCVIHLDKKNIIINYSVNMYIKEEYIYIKEEERITKFPLIP